MLVAHPQTTPKFIVVDGRHKEEVLKEETTTGDVIDDIREAPNGRI